MTRWSSIRQFGLRDGRGACCRRSGRIVVDAEYIGFQDNLKKLGEVSGEDVSTWKGYLTALR